MALHRDVLILTHLALWAQLGVLTRIFFSKFFVLGCSGQWGPCLTGGTYYGSLPPNLLGSMIMGALVSSSVVGLSTSKEVTLLPASHPWQKNIPLHIGLRTGYCGSLTTFGTWQVELMTEAISLNQWVNAIMAYIVGLAASLMAYIVGCHIALGIDRYLLPEREDVLAQEAAFLAEEVAAERGRRPPRISPSQAEELEVDLDLPRISSGPYPADPALADGTPKAALGAEEGAPGPQPRPWARWRGNRTHAATALALAALTAGWAVGAGLEREHTWIRTAFFSVLLGVPGCWLRWFLAQQLNYRQSSRCPWYPTGTLAANMLGTATSFAMAATQARAGLGYWGALLTSAVQTGFCGALTTVSTLVAEIVKFSAVYPDQFHAYTYTLHSLVGGALLGIAVYGGAYWSQ
ncbi:hypothetical protein ACKKBG_A16015 [Auxenochlorella protothecoides x Auxenochlorella symbiontica]